MGPPSSLLQTTRRKDEEDEDYAPPPGRGGRGRGGRAARRGRRGKHGPPQMEDISGYSWSKGRKVRDKSNAIYPGDEGNQVRHSHKKTKCGPLQL